MQNNLTDKKCAIMTSEELTQAITEILNAHKALEITPIDVHQLTNVCDSMIICSATSRRHASAMADKLLRGMCDLGIKPYGIEGETQGEWILIDFTDVIVHIMLPEVREFYNLEKLWQAADSNRKQQTVSEPEQE